MAGTGQARRLVYCVMVFEVANDISRAPLPIAACRSHGAGGPRNRLGIRPNIGHGSRRDDPGQQFPPFGLKTVASF